MMIGRAKKSYIAFSIQPKDMSFLSHFDLEDPVAYHREKW